MIYAKLDVCFWRHQRFIKAGPAASGYWCGCLTWLRDNDSPDGVVPEHMLGLILGVGDALAIEFCSVLVDAGLFEKRRSGYLLSKYSDKNETREEIDKRRKSTRKRMEKFRSNRSVRDAVGDAFQSGPVTSTVTAPFVPGSDSDSVLDNGEIQKETAAPTTAPIATYPGDVHHFDTQRVLITDTMREYAKMVPLTDVDGVWKKFTRISVEKQWRFDSRGWEARWQRFCDDEAQYQRRDRERARDRQGGPANGIGKPPDIPNPFGGPRALAEAAKRRREWDEAAKDAVPAPIGDLMAAISPRKQDDKK
jgi:hypothetical protein